MGLRQPMKVDLTLLHRRREKEDQAIAAALYRVGVEVDSVFDFTDRRTPVEAIPVLVELLAQDFEPWMKDGIVRALTQRNARKEAAGPLLTEFRRTPGDATPKWTIGNAMSEMADDGLYDEIAELVADRSHGRSREMMAVALGRMRKRREDAVALLRQLLKDEQVAGHALIGLRKLKAKEAEPDIEPFLQHEKAWVRKEARKALARFAKL